MDDIQLEGAAATGGDYSTWQERAGAAYENAKLNEGRRLFLSNASDLYDAEIRRIKDLTGQTLVSPFAANPDDAREGARNPSWNAAFDRFEQRRAQAIAQSPLAAPDGGVPLEHTLTPLYLQQREVEARTMSAIDRSPSAVNLWLLGKVDPASMLGSVGAMFTDPVLLLPNAIGGGPVGVGAKGIMWGGVKAAAANATATSVMQPFVQGWRKDAGLEYGFAHAAQSVAGAAVFGAIADPLVRGGFRGIRALQGREPILDAKGNVTGYQRPGQTPAKSFDAAIAEVKPTEAAPAWVGELQRALREDGPEAALDIAAQNAPEGSVLRKAADGDPQALTEVAHATGAMTDPAMRGAAAELQRYQMFGPKPDVPRGEHFETLGDSIRRSMDPAEPPAVAPDPVRPAHVEGAPLSPEATAAREALVRQKGTPTDLARIMRERPDLVTADLHLSDAKMAAARKLSRLSDDAFEAVAAGRANPMDAIAVANHVADKGMHAQVLDALTRSAVKNDAQRRMMIAETLARPGDLAPHEARMGVHGLDAEQMGQRVATLDAGVKALAKHPSLRAIVETEAAKLELGLPDAAKGDKKLRTDLGKRISDAVAEASRSPGPVADLLADVARARESGASKKLAAQVFADGIGKILDEQGLKGLAPSETPRSEMRGFSDPHGAEAKAQVKALEDRAKFAAKRREPHDGQTQGKAGEDVRGGRGDGNTPVDRIAQAADAGARREGGDVAGGKLRESRASQTRQKVRSALAAGDHVLGFDAGRDFKGTLLVEHLGNTAEVTVYLHDAKTKLPRISDDPIKTMEQLDRLNSHVATMSLSEREPHAFEIGYVSVDPRRKRQGIGTHFYDTVERDLGIELRPSGRLTDQGRAFWQRRAPELVANHRLDTLHMDELWKSPRQLLDERANAVIVAERFKTKQALEKVRHYDDLLATIPAEAKTPDALRQMFSLKDPVHLTAAGEAAWPKVRSAVEQVVARLPREVRVEMRHRLVVGGREVEGLYDPYVALVRVAMGDGADRVLRHEEIHVLRDLRLMSEAEFRVLVDRGIADGAMAKFAIADRYRPLYEKRFGGDHRALAAAMAEEMVAEMWGAARRGDLYGRQIDGVFKRLTTFVADLKERLTNAKNGLGFQSAEDIFRRIETGEIGRRQRPAERPQWQTDTMPVGLHKSTKFSLSEVPEPRRRPSPKTFEPMLLPEAIKAIAGLEGHAVYVDPHYIAAKRNLKDTDRGGVLGKGAATPEKVRAMVADVLANPDYVRLYKDGQTINVIKHLPNGDVANVSVRLQPDDRGRHFVPTAYIMSANENRRALAGVLVQHGSDGVKWKGATEALRADLASVSERSAKGPWPPEALDSTVGELRQRLDAGSDRPQTPGAMLAADADRADLLGTLAQVCKR